MTEIQLKSNRLHKALRGHPLPIEPTKLLQASEENVAMEFLVASVWATEMVRVKRHPLQRIERAVCARWAKVLGPEIQDVPSAASVHHQIIKAMIPKLQEEIRPEDNLELMSKVLERFSAALPRSKRELFEAVTTNPKGDVDA